MKKQTFNPENPNGIIEDMTAEEQAQREADIANDANDISMNKKIEDQKEIKSSAKAKLMSGEALTEEEANTIVI
tara:strand:- start:7 stop:228 length:222 start_codon:yes stop_codon:yes gene_type:complete